MKLKNGDLVKIGALTFALSIEGAPVQASSAPPNTTKKAGSLDDLSHDDIDSWLVSDASKEPPDRPSGVYGGETVTIDSLKFRDRPDSKAITTAKAPAAAPVPTPKPEAVPEPEPEPEPEPAEEPISQYHEEAEDDGIEDLSKTLAAEAEDDLPEEMIDESNPFHVKKKAEAAPALAKGPQKDSSDAANDILRKMMDRRKAAKS
jgi:hypothetical protein